MQSRRNGAVIRGISAGLFFMMAGTGAFSQVAFDVAGDDEDLAGDLRAASLLIAAEEEGTTDPQELLAAARADYARLIGALYADGRFGGVINIRVNGREAARIPPITRIDRIERIEVSVQPGPPYLFSRVEVAPIARGTDLPDGFAPGEPARTTVIRDAAEAAVTGWRETGRAKAEVADQQITARHEADRLAARLRMRPGPVVRFGDLILKGGESVTPRRLRKIAGLPSGEVFSPVELDRVATRLRRTGVFSAVALEEAEMLGPGNTMDITATLAEQEPRRIGFGAEYSTIDGATLSAFWLHRNLLGGAERLRLDGEISGIAGDTGGEDYSFGARLTRPATPRADTDAFIEAGIERLNEPDFDSKTGTLGIGFTRYATDDLTVEAGFRYRFSEITDDSGTSQYGLLSLPLSAVYDSREEPLDATQGYFADVSLTPFAGFQDAGDGARLTFDARSYYGFGAEDRFVVAGRVQGGSIIGADVTGVPNDFRFYSGGGGTVRGQDYQSLGITLPDGTESGGASYLGLSAEFRAGVTDNIGLVAFYDYGTVSADSFPGSDADHHAGAGLGVRYLTPIGPIRLDVAAPIGGDDSGAEIYVGIGQAF